MPGRMALRAPTEGKLQGGGAPRAITLEKTLVPHRSLRYESTSFCFVFWTFPSSLLQIDCCGSLGGNVRRVCCWYPKPPGVSLALSIIVSFQAAVKKRRTIQLYKYNSENFPLYGLKKEIR